MSNNAQRDVNRFTFVKYLKFNATKLVIVSRKRGTFHSFLTEKRLCDKHHRAAQSTLTARHKQRLQNRSNKTQPNAATKCGQTLQKNSFFLVLTANVRNFATEQISDKNGLECDAVLHLRNGSYGLIEIKLGGAQAIEKGVATLTSLASKIDTTKMKAPSFMMVLTAVGDYAYQRKDGVYIVPIGCLKN